MTAERGRRVNASASICLSWVRAVTPWAENGLQFIDVFLTEG